MENMPLPYHDYGRWMRKRFNVPVQKLAVDAGFSCPNRDGTKGLGGCVFCNNSAFSPSYCGGKSVRAQIMAGKAFFGHKYPSMKYLAYFQTYTNTYASLDVLKSLYEEALDTDCVVGLIIGTRPDCVSGELLDYLETLSRHTFVTVEYGIESTDDRQLEWMNRGHTFECSRRMVVETAARGIVTGGHIILGLPGDTAASLVCQAEQLSALPLDILKLHQLQVVRHTPLAAIYQRCPFPLYSVEGFVKTLGEYIQHLRPTLVLDRFVAQAPKGMVIAPQWGLKNHEFTNILVNYMRKNQISQGQKWRPSAKG